MKKSRKSARRKIEPKESEFLSSFERGEWKTVPNVEKEKLRARKTAAKTQRKDVRINIRLSSSDINYIKQIAAYEGLPYQTLIASVLHKYATGHLTTDSKLRS
jgi:predicted DNA binding CopG/RHH family protein